jgi:Citrate transporter
LPIPPDGVLATWGIAGLATAGVIARPFRLPEAVWAVAGAVVLVAFGLLPWTNALTGVGKGLDVYFFLTGMMLIAEVARHEGVFDWLAALAVKHARGSPQRLFTLVYGVGTAVTVLLSNDATAIVLTPAVYAATRAAGATPLPYLFVCAFIANAASFVLPISNPANLVILAVTVAYNIRMADAYTNNYRQMFGLPINRDLPAAALCVHEYPKVWLYQWQPDGSWLEEPRTVYDDTWHAHCIYVTAELMHRRYDARIVMAMAAAHQLSALEASMDGRRVICQWHGLHRVAHFVKAAAVMAQVDPVDYGLLERKGREMVLAPQPAEQWVTHLADMNWPYAMGAAHLFTHPFLREIARSEYGLTERDLTGRPFNQLKNYVWSQLGQMPLYEILVREGADAARQTVKQLVVK